MTDVNEIRALKASLRGALDTAATLTALQQKVEAIDDRTDVSSDMLDELGRVTLAHAVASAALRGLVESMRSRRGLETSVPAAAGDAE